LHDGHEPRARVTDRSPNLLEIVEQRARAIVVKIGPEDHHERRATSGAIRSRTYAVAEAVGTRTHTGAQKIE
jgi:hypothetical protein